ncbi:MAG TPA: hypothetical protein VK666_20005 [Chryseolinea sp.]|nr:hypothetical protein [Chryseolinea sp.]
MLKRAVVTAILLSIMSFLSAQPHDPPVDPDNAVPIKGIEILLIAGAALGIGKLIALDKSAHNQR